MDLNSLLTTQITNEVITSTQKKMAEASLGMVPTRDRLRASRNLSMKNQPRNTSKGRLEWNLTPNFTKPIQLETAYTSLAFKITNSSTIMSTAKAKK